MLHHSRLVGSDIDTGDSTTSSSRQLEGLIATLCCPQLPPLPHSMGRAPHSSNGIGARTKTVMPPSPMNSTRPSTAGMRSCLPFRLPCRVPQAPSQPLQLPQLPLHPRLPPHDIENVAGLPASQRQGLGVEEARVPRKRAEGVGEAATTSTHYLQQVSKSNSASFSMGITASTMGTGILPVRMGAFGC